MACAGDIPTKEALAATDMLRQEFPDLKIRFVNVVDLFKLQPDTEHPHGLTDRDFDSLFTVDKPIIFEFHGYPWLIHRLAYRRTNHANLHVRGYKEKGNINTPLELAIQNQIDRFTLAMDVIDRVPKLAGRRGARQGEVPQHADRVRELRLRARRRSSPRPRTGSGRTEELAKPQADKYSRLRLRDICQELLTCARRHPGSERRFLQPQVLGLRGRRRSG